MNNYFPSLMAVASRNTDTYVGKVWTNTQYPEVSSLGLSMAWPLTSGAIPTADKVVADFSGYTAYTTDGVTIYPVYQGPLRASIVGTLKLDPTYTRGVYYSGVGDFVCCTDVSAQEVRVASSSNGGATWTVSQDWHSLIGVQEPIGMFVHEQLVGSPDPRIVILTNNKAVYSDPYPLTAVTTFTAATGYSGTMYGAAYSISARLLTTVGVGGQVRYSSNATSWASTLVTGTFSASTFRSVAWSGDETVCLAVGDGGALATSPDGINFTSSNALTTAGFTGRPGTIIRGTGTSDFYMIAPNGTVAFSGNYGATWLLYTNKFSLVQTVDSGVNDTPVTAWIYKAGIGVDALFVSAYGGQLFTQTITGIFSPAPMTNQSNAFSNYYYTFNTADITGVWAKQTFITSAASEPVVYMTGGQGRLMYMTDQATPWPTDDLTLLNWLQANGYTADISSAVHYDRSTTQVVVGLTNGRVAYRTAPATPTSWTLDTLPGVTSKIIGIALTGTTYVAIAEDGSIGYGTPSGGGYISWSVSTTALKSLLSSAICCNLSYKLFPTGPFPGGYMVALASNSGVAYSADLFTWSVYSVGSETLLLPMLVDANLVDVSGTPTWRWFYFLSGPYGSSSDATVYTTFNNASWSSVGTAMTNEATGMFTFGSPKISTVIGSDGIGSISLDPTTYGSWGSSMGVTNQFAPPSVPGAYYLPPTTITKTVGTTLTTLSRNLAVSAGERGRVWVSADPVFFP